MCTRNSKHHSITKPPKPPKNLNKPTRRGFTHALPLPDGPARYVVYFVGSLGPLLTLKVSMLCLWAELGPIQVIQATQIDPKTIQMSSKNAIKSPSTLVSVLGCLLDSFWLTLPLKIAPEIHPSRLALVAQSVPQKRAQRVPRAYSDTQNGAKTKPVTLEP